MLLFFFLNQGLWGMTSRLLVLESVTAGALISCLFMCRCLSVMCWWSACVSVVGAAPARVLTGAAQIPHVCVWALDLWRVTLKHSPPQALHLHSQHSARTPQRSPAHTQILYSTDTGLIHDALKSQKHIQLKIHFRFQVEVVL